MFSDTTSALHCGQCLVRSFLLPFTVFGLELWDRTLLVVIRTFEEGWPPRISFSVETTSINMTLLRSIRRNSNDKEWTYLPQAIIIKMRKCMKNQVASKQSRYLPQGHGRRRQGFALRVFGRVSLDLLPLRSDRKLLRAVLALLQLHPLGRSVLHRCYLGRLGGPLTVHKLCLGLVMSITLAGARAWQSSLRLHLHVLL